MMVYLLAYLFMNLGAFLVVTLDPPPGRHASTCATTPGSTAARRSSPWPWPIFLLSLMGIPPLVGFMGKLYVFAAIIEKGRSYWWFAVVGAVNAAIAAYYYARILKTMIIDAGNEEKPRLPAGPGRRGLGAALVAGQRAAAAVLEPHRGLGPRARCRSTPGR